jgi:hypothetical protein
MEFNKQENNYFFTSFCQIADMMNIFEGKVASSA